MPSRALAPLALAFVLSSCGGSDGPRYATEFLVVDVPPETPATVQIAVQACAGLANRELGGSVYVQSEPADAQWLSDLGLAPSATVGPDEFLATCMEERRSCVRYAYATQQALMPNILTAGAALDAVPLDEGLSVSCDDVALDARVAFAELDTPSLATRYAFENYLSRTTGLAMLNPGYDIEASDLANPDLTRDTPAHLIDFVFSERLFVVFLVNGCSASSEEGQVLSDIVNAGRWPTPLGVYGYNNSWLVGGFLHEAQTRCLPSRNMGAIPSETGNLSFFSTRRPAITHPSDLPPIPPEELAYDAAKTYVAFVVGDGDNVRYVMTQRRDWLVERIAGCSGGGSCAPLTWTISPHLVHLAPDVLDWYYASLGATGADYFALPPSGHLYAYPTSMPEAEQDRFAAATESDARILGATSVVHWDYFGTWNDAEALFLPKYARAGGAIRSVVPVNVPYFVDAFPWWPDESFYQVLTGEDGSPLVVFRPRQWRGVDDSDTRYFLSPANMAAEIGSYPPGTITAIYMTSDGGLSLGNSFTTLVDLLPSHVELVSVDAAARLAVTATGD